MTPSTSTASSLLRLSLNRTTAPIASSSRVQLRCIHTTQVQRNEDDRSPPRSDSGSWANLSNIVEQSYSDGNRNRGAGPNDSRSQGRSFRFRDTSALGGNGIDRGSAYTNRGHGPQSFAVSTSQSDSSGSGMQRGASRPAYRKPVPGQMASPDQFRHEALTEVKPGRARRLLGPTNKEAKRTDQIHRLGLNPGKASLHDDSYKNGALLAKYTTSMGKIKPRSLTLLTRTNQRHVAKAIRRAKSMGILAVFTDQHEWA